MLDIKFIEQNTDLVKKAAQDKNVNVDIDELLVFNSRRKDLQTKIDLLKQQRNEISKGIRGEKPSEKQITEGKDIKKELAVLEKEHEQVKNNWQTIMDIVPNIPTEDTPVGKTEEENKVLRTVGELPQFDFKPKEHWELGDDLNVIDNTRAAKVSGSRFTYIKGELAFLEFALIQYILSVVTDENILQSIISGAGLEVPPTPFIPVIAPAIIKRDTLYKMARLEPQDDRYHIPQDDVFLVGSAEHTMGAMHMDETFKENVLPLRYIGFSPSFRREAGSHGKDVRGILRLHQFDKLEMESFTRPETSIQEQDFLVAIQEYIMRGLKLPYQVVLKCTGDMGSPDARAIDIETWMPGQNKYRETHTSDLMTDYQSRRLKTKVKRKDGETRFVHMNDATAAAIGRTIIAIMENNQQADGSIAVPEALYPYLPFKTIARK